MPNFQSADPIPSLTYKPRLAHRQPLPDDAAESMTRKLTGYGSSALQAGLHVLDTPGSIVRGGLGKLVGARPQEGERTSGRDLTNAIGLTSKHSKSWVHSGLGLAAEILSDPLTYATFGTHSALTGAGKAIAKTGGIKALSRKAMLEGFHGLESTHLSDAAKLGQAPAEALSGLAHERAKGFRIATPAQEKSVSDSLGRALKPNEPLAGLGGIGIPFRDPSFVFGTGRRAQAVAGGLDKLGSKFKYGTTLGRWSNQLFDPKVGEAVGRETQMAKAAHGSPARDAHSIAGRDDLYRVIRGIDSPIKAGLPEADILRVSRQMLEGASPRLGKVGMTPDVIDPTLHAAGQHVADIVRKGEARQLDDATRLGLPLEDLNDPYSSYAPRHGHDTSAIQALLDGKQPGKAGLSPQVITDNNLPVRAGDDFHRQAIYRGVPGGSTMIDDWARAHAGDPLKLGPAGLQRQFKKDMWLEYANQGKVGTASIGKEFDAKATAMAQHIAAKPTLHSEHGIGIFSDNLARDVARSAEQNARKMDSAETVHGYLGTNARPFVKDSGMVPISQTLKALGMKTRMADEATGTPIQGALAEAYRRMAKQGAPQVDPLLMGKLGPLRKAADQYGLTQALHDQLVADHGRWSMPEVAKGPMGLFDNLTSTFKNLAYPIWPASHVRNAASAFLNNLATGTKFGDHAAQLGLMRGTITADEIRKLMPTLPAGISDDDARDLVRREQFSTGKVFDGHSGQFDIDNGLSARLNGGTPGRTTPELFGTDRTGSGNLAGDTARLIGGGIKDQAVNTAKWLARKHDHSPISAAGVFGGTVDNPALATGRAVGSNIEDFARGAHWFGQRRQGFDAATAGRSTRDLHFDYDALTNFEKKTMRRLVPFYTFARKNLPLQVDRTLHTPAQTLLQMRAMSAGREPGAYLPDYLSGGAAVPTGPEVDGKRQFISGFGTPLEEALERFKFKGGMPDIPATALAFGANLNPLIKAPVEQVFNTQLHTGRKLSDLHAPSTASAIGKLWGDDNPQMLSQFLVNTPATRFITSFDRLIDGRKGMLAKLANMGTGLKVTDVDLERSRVAEAANARNEILSSMPHIKGFTNYYVRPGEEANLSPDEIEMLRMQAYQQGKAREANPRKKIGLLARRSGE